MNKGQLISKITADTKLTKTQAGSILESLIRNTIATLKKGDKLILVGFGSFSVLKRSARLGRNPQTGKALKIPAKKVVKFRAGKEFARKIK